MFYYTAMLIRTFYTLYNLTKLLPK